MMHKNNIISVIIFGLCTSCSAQEPPLENNQEKPTIVEKKVKAQVRVDEPEGSRMGSLQSIGERYMLKGTIIAALNPGILQEDSEGGGLTIQDPEIEEFFASLGVTELQPVIVGRGEEAKTVPNYVRLFLSPDQDMILINKQLQDHPKIVLSKPIYVRFGQRQMINPRTGMRHAEPLSTFPDFEEWDFERGLDGKFTRDFAAISSLPDEAGNWIFEEGTLNQISPDKKADLYHFAILTPYENHEIKMKVQIKATAGTLYKGGGITYRFSDLDNYYLIGLDFLENKIFFERVFKGQRDSLMVLDVPLKEDQWYALEVVNQGSRCVAFIDGKPYINQTDNKMWHGKVGLWTKADALTSFDDFSVESFAKK